MAAAPSPITIATTAESKCHIEGCPNQGNNICRYYIPNRCCTGSKSGGCGKRYCAQHAFLSSARTVSVSGAPLDNFQQACVLCGKEMQTETIKRLQAQMDCIKKFDLIYETMDYVKKL